MENLPLPDASLDAVVCVYCFHEMPESARAAEAKEWFRGVVCRGGCREGEGKGDSVGGVVCVYCLHEMPEAAGAAAAKE
jgi:ubiquinone/menaquinone biosynthesis C-methylase UbiE